MPLTVTAIRNAKPRTKPYKLFDGGGLYLEVATNGGKWWRLKYRFGGKEKRISLGVYPDVGLKDARERRDHARKELAAGIDPGEVRKARKAARASIDENNFEAIAREWHANSSRIWTDDHSKWVLRRFECDIFPWIGTQTISEITAPVLLKTLFRIQSRGARETAHRALQSCGQVFRYAIATGRAERDLSADLRGALAPVEHKHYPSITEPKAVGELLRTMDAYEGSLVTKCALQLAPLVFVRPGELRRAEWSDIDLDAAEWRMILEKKKKTSTKHIVPLSQQAVEILSELHPLTGTGRYVFPGMRTNSRPMSENTVNAALRRLGYSKEEVCGHGFRSTASTLLHEQGWPSDAIERQLGHAERNRIKAAYNRAEHLPERRKMMQDWANYLDKLKIGAEVIALSQRA